MRLFRMSPPERTAEDEVAATRLMAIASRSKGSDPFAARKDIDEPPSEEDTPGTLQ